jgi:hypothetical protein
MAILEMPRITATPINGLFTFFLPMLCPLKRRFG